MKNENYLLNFVKYFSIDGIIMHYSTRQFNSEEQLREKGKERAFLSKPTQLLHVGMNKEDNHIVHSPRIT